MTEAFNKVPKGTYKLLREVLALSESSWPGLSHKPYSASLRGTIIEVSREHPGATLSDGRKYPRMSLQVYRDLGDFAGVTSEAVISPRDRLVQLTASPDSTAISQRVRIPQPNISEMLGLLRVAIGQHPV